jgi:hypothetical protein
VAGGGEFAGGERGWHLAAGGTLPQFLASYCISDVCEEHFLDSIFVFQKMTAANSSKPDTCQKLWQGGKVLRR